MSSKKKIDNKQDFIHIKGAKMHNLKDINLSIPKKKLIVITGVSGSGKSSLAFDTLFAEGQRRYIESLSSYARQFLGKLQKPEVDKIIGLSPAIAIEQKVNSQNPRSTVGTSTEIYDYLKLLFARIGKTISPISNKEVRKHQVSDVVNFICKKKEGQKFMILSKVNSNDSPKKILHSLALKGFSRVKVNSKVHRINEVEHESTFKKNNPIWIVIDRLVTNNDQDNLVRLADSIQTAFYEGNGKCSIDFGDDDISDFSNVFERDGMEFQVPSEHMFSFNNPYGACTICEGFGTVLGIDEEKVIPNNSLSVFEGAVSCWKGEKLGRWKDRFILNSSEHDFPVHKPYIDLSDEQKKLLWNGGRGIKGIRQFFQLLERENYKVQNRVMLARYRGKSQCNECNGSRLKKEALYVQVGKKTIDEIVNLPLKETLNLFNELVLTKNDLVIAERLLEEIKNRLNFLVQVGLDYLTINRLSSTLSGGESQRINLATSLASSLVGSMYILDEPSIGLHSKDTERLIKILKSLKQLGNTVIVVEHDEDIMKEADEIIDIGPLAGKNGGNIVFQGKLKNITNGSSESLTAQYLSNLKRIDIPKKRREFNKAIHIKGARENNLKSIDVTFPLGVLTVVTGVSGSGKSSLVKQILFPAIQKSIQGYTTKLGAHNDISGSYESIKHIEYINQNPIGRSSRSNPVTYLKAYDEIRNLYARQDLAKARGYKSGQFSFNTSGGRCDMCEGEGEVKIEMQFMADIFLKCEHCDGQRFKNETLEIKFKDKSISDILNLTIDQAIDFFKINEKNKIVKKLLPLQKVGLGYIQLGQSSNTLSGGEAQRVKLAYFLSKGDNAEKTLFIFDEPTTGLHFNDIVKLLNSFYALLDNGHSIVCVEHNLDIIKCADWVIDLGPEGGNEGGKLLFQGIPEDLIKNTKSYTAKYLKEKL
ncbi:MAG: excinuclease ABC subunit UvrA [Flavobacteriales bacterium]